jgi:hypothetical protein
VASGSTRGFRPPDYRGFRSDRGMSGSAWLPGQPGCGLWPRNTAVRGLGVIITGRPGLAMVPEFGEPAVHLIQVGLLEHARIVRPDLDFHVGPLPLIQRRAPCSRG